MNDDSEFEAVIGTLDLDQRIVLMALMLGRRVWLHFPLNLAPHIVI